MKVLSFVARGNEDTLPQPYWEELDPTEVMVEIQGGSNVSDLPRGTLTGSGLRDSWFTQEYFSALLLKTYHKKKEIMREF